MIRSALLPSVALAAALIGIGGAILFAGDTLGFDFLAYHAAAVRVLHGQPLYDMSYTQTGGFGLFYYPPTFAPLVLVLGLLPSQLAVGIWVAGLVVAMLAGIAILPVPRDVRWWTLLLAGLSFPVIYAIKLGQVGPILFLLFVAGWRWLDRPAPLGVSAALGAAIKIQPGLILGWALLTRRSMAVVIGAIVLAVLAGAATVLSGLGAWPDFLTLVRTVSDPISTPHNFTVGAVAFRLGVPAGPAATLQLVSIVAALALGWIAIRRCSAEASYLAVVIVSQLVSPILWDHYALLLLLPVAYLMADGRPWAALIPVVTSWPLVSITPSAAYPVVFWLTLLAVVWFGRRPRSVSPATVASATMAA